MSAVLETPFSDLINRPKDTVALLSRSHARRLRLRRRDAEDLVLTTASRYEQERTVVSASTRVLAALIAADPGHALLLRLLPEVFPWVRFLPAGDIPVFLDELVSTMRAVDDLDIVAPVGQVIVEWRHTAEVHADPELATALAQPADDLGPVPEPAADR
jgi:hypothetical protein